jgi:protoporphyrinogen oxidase
VSEICVLGTGMAGFGAAYSLREAGRKAILFDKQPHYGGHTTSVVYESKYTFDEGPHVSFTKDERIRGILADAVDQKYEVLNTKVNNHWKGYWIKHPAQVNLYGLPSELVIRIITDYVQAKQQPPREIHTYEDWLRASFGNTFAETFPMEYTIKYHTTTAANMSTDWIGPRLYQASLEEILRGALVPGTTDVHYIDGFRYPTRGGFVSYLRRFMEDANIRLEHEVVSIDPKRREIRFANGSVGEYSGLISSMPLPELIPAIVGTPADVLDAASRLACSEVVIVNLVVDRADLIDAHWTYFYDQDIFFARISTRHRQSPHNVPPGCGSLQVECYYSKKYRPLDRPPDQCIGPVISDLKRVGVLRESDQVLFQNTMYLRYANVIFDLERADALKTVHGYLDDIGIAYCGRYGDWRYIWTDESFLSGERAAQKVLNGIRNGD